MRRIGRIFLYLFASFGVLMTLFFVCAIVFAITYDRVESDLPERVVLRLNLDHGVSDGRYDDPWRRLRGDEAVKLHDVVSTLATAETDERVVGMAIRLGASRISLAHAQELRESITAFRSRGKFVLAFAQTFGSFGNATMEYYLASSADQVWVQPSGKLSFLGIGFETPYLKGALDKAGVKAEFEQRHEYKSAIELLTHDGMSAPARASLMQVVGSWLDKIVFDIAGDRKTTPETIRQLVDRSPLLATEALDAKLIDRLGYLDSFNEAVKQRAGENTLEVTFVRYATQIDNSAEEGTDVALIYGIGPIQPGEAGNSPWDPEVFAAGSVARAIDAAAANEATAAILLRIDSPGGSYIGSDIVRQAVVKAKKKGKLVIASMGQYGASGGYFVAMAADKIVAQPGTMTGSIGVFGGKLATRDLWTKFGVSWNRVSAGAHAGMWSQVFPFSPTAAARHRAVIDFVYDDFTRKVAEDRNLSEGHVDNVARGRVWSGSDAQRVGLVDALGGYAAAAELVREALSLEANEPLNFIILPKPLSPLERLTNALSEGIPFTQALTTLALGSQTELLDGVLRHIKPVIGDIGVLFPPAGVLQLPLMRPAP